MRDVALFSNDEDVGRRGAPDAPHRGHSLGDLGMAYPVGGVAGEVIGQVAHDQVGDVAVAAVGPAVRVALAAVGQDRPLLGGDDAQVVAVAIVFRPQGHLGDPGILGQLLSLFGGVVPDIVRLFFPPGPVEQDLSDGSALRNDGDLAGRFHVEMIADLVGARLSHEGVPGHLVVTVVRQVRPDGLVDHIAGHHRGGRPRRRVRRGGLHLEDLDGSAPGKVDIVAVGPGPGPGRGHGPGAGVLQRDDQPFAVHVGEVLKLHRLVVVEDDGLAVLPVRNGGNTVRVFGRVDVLQAARSLYIFKPLRYPDPYPLDLLAALNGLVHDHDNLQLTGAGGVADRHQLAVRRSAMGLCLQPGQQPDGPEGHGDVAPVETGHAVGQGVVIVDSVIPGTLPAVRVVAGADPPKAVLYAGVGGIEPVRVPIVGLPRPGPYDHEGEQRRDNDRAHHHDHQHGHQGAEAGLAAKSALRSSLLPPQRILQPVPQVQQIIHDFHFAPSSYPAAAKKPLAVPA